MHARSLLGLAILSLIEPADGASERLLYRPAGSVGRPHVRLIETKQIIPGEGTFAPPRVGASNNNLDVVRHSDGRVYLAWRTSTDHYASSKTRLRIVSSVDEVSWREEATVSLSTDLREPRFLSFRGRLFLYFAELGSDPLAFEPKGAMRIEQLGPGKWSEPELALDGFIPWRLRAIDGHAYLSAYVHGGAMYDFIDPHPIEVFLFESEDGENWQAVSGGPVLSGGGTETDFLPADDGGLVAVVRNESGDDSGWGSKVCRAEPGSWGRWSCRTDSRKFDSPLLFRHSGRLFLVARRNVTASGRFQFLDTSYGTPLEKLVYHLDYLSARKRCSLWTVDPNTLSVGFVLDLPSRGDTCFAGMIEGQDPTDVIVYNYSSNIEGPDLPWYMGQHQTTRIYRHVLRLPRR